MRRTTRREWLERWAGWPLLSLTGCRDRPSSPAAEVPELRLLCWSRFFDPQLLSKFEEQRQCQLVVSHFETNEELFTRLDADPTVYDVVTPSSYLTPQLVADKRLLEIDAAGSDFAGNDALVAGQSAGTAVSTHAISYSWSAAGIAYHEKHGPLPSRSWRVFSEPGLTGRFTLLEDMRELLGAGLKVCGKSANTTVEADLKEAAAVVAQWMSNARKLDNEAYTYALIAGEDLAAQGYNGDVWIAGGADSDLRFVIPDEGTTLAVDQLCVSSGANHPDLARAFVAFMCQAENARQNMEWSGYLSVIPKVIESAPELLKALTKEHSTALTNSEVIAPLGEGNRLWEAVWQELFSRKNRGNPS